MPVKELGTAGRVRGGGLSAGGGSAAGGPWKNARNILVVESRALLMDWRERVCACVCVCVCVCMCVGV